LSAVYFKWLFAYVMYGGIAFLVLGAPLFLWLGRRALLQGRIDRAGDLTTIAVVSSWFLFPIAAWLGVLMAGGANLEPRLVAMLPLLYPGALLYAGSRLSSAVRRKREEAVAAARGVDWP